jgi:hypothetical protein
MHKRVGPEVFALARGVGLGCDPAIRGVPWHRGCLGRPVDFGLMTITRMGLGNNRRRRQQVETGEYLDALEALLVGDRRAFGVDTTNGHVVCRTSRTLADAGTTTRCLGARHGHANLVDVIEGSLLS